MAEVYLGRHVGPVGFEKTVAIKRLHPSLSQREDLVRMFLSEARVAARLSHPNIAQIFELGHTGGEYYIVMEFLHGRRLAEVQDETQRIGERVPHGLAAHIVAGVCRALHHAHTLRDELGNLFGLLHGDVNPDNVMIGFSGDVKLTDFGVAKATSLAAETQTGILKGKFGYMSPEQCRNEEADHRGDIFAAGILLFELTCGRRLFVRATDFETVRAVIKGIIPPPSAVVDDVPDELEEVIMTALARDPEMRYQNAQEMQLALEAAIRANSWRTGPLALSRYISAMFSDRITPSSGFPRVALANKDGRKATAPPSTSADPRTPDAPSRLPEADESLDALISRQGLRAAPATDQPATAPSLDQEWMDLDTADVPASPSDESSYQSNLETMPIQEDVPTVDAPVPPDLSMEEPPAALPAPSVTAPEIATSPAPGADLEMALPDLNMEEGPTIIQPPDFDDIEPAPAFPPIPDTPLPDGISESVPFQPYIESIGEPLDVPVEPPGAALHGGRARRSWLLWAMIVLLLVLATAGATVGFLIGTDPWSSKTSLTVSSTPTGATIYLDGKELYDKTPVVVRQIKPGRPHWLVVTKDGFRTTTRRFKIERAQHLRITVDLKPLRSGETALLHIKSKPTGATIYMDGNQRGVAPVVLPNVAAGVEHTLVAKKDGYRDFTLVIADLKPASRRQATIVLKRRTTKRSSRSRASGVSVPRGVSGSSIRK